MSAAELLRLSKLRNLQTEMTNLDRQIAQKEGEERRLRGVMAELSSTGRSGADARVRS
mgnify:CR=1 FL=1